MMRMCLIAAEFALGWLSAQAALPPGCLGTAQPHIRVYDFADLLTASEEQQLNVALQQGSDTTASTVVVVTHPDFCGLEPFEFATGVGEAWGVDRSGADRGVVLVLKPRAQGNSGQVFIATGRGAEGDLTDALAGRIVQQIRPQLAEGDFAGGLERGTAQIFAVLATGDLPEVNDGARPFPWPAGVLLAFVFLVVPVWLVLAGVRKTARTYRMPYGAAWAIYWAAQRHSNARFSHFSGGTGPFSGGGFSGFGGGRFGGGGAGGSF